MEYLIDTSSLIEAYERNAFEALRSHERVRSIEMPEYVAHELESIASGADTRSRSARGALALARQTLKVGLKPATQSHVDDALLEAAEKRGVGIISQDHELIRRAKERGIATLTIKRSGKIGD